MTIAERIEQFPSEYQAEIIDFVDHLEKVRAQELRQLEEVITRARTMTDEDIDPRTHEEIMAALRSC